MSSRLSCSGCSCYGLAKEPIVLARLIYLSFNLVFILLNLLCGYFVYETTKSLTIEVDFLSFGCEVLAVIINILIEVWKRKSVHPRSIMVLDLVGGLSSISLLICIGLFGLYSAINATEELNDNRSFPQPAGHLDKMLQFSTFSLCLSVTNLGIFATLKEQMLPVDGNVHDQLNVLSNLAHSVVDFVTNFAVLGTSLWLQFGINEESYLAMRKHKVWVDVFGSFMVCACILVSVCWLLRDVLYCIFWIRQMAADEEMEALMEEAAGARVVETIGKKASKDYGTLAPRPVPAA